MNMNMNIYSETYMDVDLDPGMDIGTDMKMDTDMEMDTDMQCCGSEIIFSGSGSYLDLNFGSGFGSGSGLLMKNT